MKTDKKEEEASKLLMIRLPIKIYEAVDRAVAVNLHRSKAELIRDAIRRYLEEHFPELIKKGKAEEGT